MAGYQKKDARAWAREHLIGCSGVTIPSFTADLKSVNDKATAHDIELLASLGYQYTLLCSEIAITPEENARVTAVARETAGRRLGLFFHAAFSTLQENIEAVKLAEKAGADVVLLSYPPQFRPTTEQEIYDYTRAFCDATDLGVMLFAGACEMYHHFRDEVVISIPIESDAIPLMSLMDLQFSGTSNTQWMSDYYPRAFALARQGDWQAAMELYWQVHPARLANGAAGQSYIAGTGVINRSMWKYQDWLAGFNGGPLRGPVPRVPDRIMASLRRGLLDSGLPATADPDTEYLTGRNPA